MVETLFHGKDRDYVVQVPALTELVEQDDTEIFVVGPATGSKGHNLDRPDLCRCFPVYWCYTDESGKVDTIFVEHKWEM